MTSDMESDASDAKRLCAAEDEFVNYDVFISHRGPDVKTSFVGFLYEALKRVGLHPFLDCKSIGKGQDSWKCIDQAIQTTPLALVIFSESFAQSEWCLRELHAMLDTPFVKVLPIFYNVKPWELNFLEKGQLAIGFSKLIERHDTSIIEEWRADLKRASRLNGWEHQAGEKRLEANLVLEVVDKVFELANKPLPLDVGDHIVGVKQVAENLIQALAKKKVLMLGLWGMGGIGKSTLAKELYNQLGQRFVAKCYVEDVAEKVKQGSVTIVQNQILKDLCEKENITDKSLGKVILGERLSKKRILLVLDDVHDNSKMDCLISRQMLKEGSLCIVTSRDRRVFETSTSFDVKHEVDTYKVQLLSERDSRSVFACHAFGGDGKVPPRFGGLVGDVSHACGGVPLVLKVCGSLLMGEEDVEIWEEILKKLNCGSMMADRKIFECLRISYDALEVQHQEMFLDIACALLGESVEMAKLVWRFGAYGVRTLIEKALITVDDKGAFRMHNHLRDMGRAIAKQESASSGICKRLWGLESSTLLNKNEPLLDFLETLSLRSWHGSEIDLSCMKELRILKCEDCLFSMFILPKNLRWLYHITKMNARLIPFPESPENNELVILFWMDDVLESLPESFENLKKLKVLNLAWCGKLEELPDSLGGLQNLENLNLEGSGIQSLPKSLGMLSKLKVLNLSCCDELKELPNSLGGLQSLEDLNFEQSGIQSLSKSLGTLSKLKVLNLVSCSKLKELPDSLEGLQSLEDLKLKRSGIQSLPKSLGTLSKLKVLNLRWCSKLEELPNSLESLQSLEDLKLEGSGIRSLPKSLSSLSKLKVLDLRWCGKLEELPDSLEGLQSLEDLKLEGSGIQSLPKSLGMLNKLKVLNLSWCRCLKELPDSFGGLQSLEDLKLKRSGIQSLPKSLGTLSKLEVLNFNECDQLKELPDSLEDLQNLENLYLERSGIQSLPKSLGMLSKLKVLDLRWCGKLEELPDSLGGLQSLEDLKLEKSGIRSLPKSLGTLSKLKVLDLRWCSKLKELPDSLGGLQSLEDLKLERSGIQSLPKSLGTLSKLKVLNLNECDHLKEIPDSLKGLLNFEKILTPKKWIPKCWI